MEDTIWQDFVVGGRHKKHPLAPKRISEGDIGNRSVKRPIFKRSKLGSKTHHNFIEAKKNYA